MRYQKFLSIISGLPLRICTVVAIQSIKDGSASLNNRVGNSHSLFSRDLPTGTCNAQTPCPIAACCGTNGLCGYSPSECGAGKCISKCDSKADCGQYGVPGKQNCPLNVCCSEFGCVMLSEKFWFPQQFSTDINSQVLRLNR